MSTSAEYVEKLVADAYKRELDQEENVFRSMPFFATTFGVVATAIGLARPAIGPLDGTPAAICIYLLLAATFLATAAGLAFLFQAVRARKFEMPMGDHDLIAWRKKLESFYAEAGESEEATNAAIMADLRDDMTRQLATATALARANNLSRNQARGRAAGALIIAIGLVFALFLIILLRDAGMGGLGHVANAPGHSVAPQSAGRP